MKHKAKLTITRPNYSDGRKKISITVDDSDAGIRFLDIEIDMEKFSEALTGVAYTECHMEFRGLQNVGKKIEIDELVFPIGSSDVWFDYKKKAIELLPKYTPEGWEASKYFGSKISFFDKNGTRYARTKISRWIDKHK